MQVIRAHLGVATPRRYDATAVWVVFGLETLLDALAFGLAP